MESKDNEKVSYYLPRHEFLEKRLEMFKYIDDGDKRVESQLEQVNLSLHTFIESQKPMQETMNGLLEETKTMNKNITKQVRRTEKVEDEQVRIKESITTMQEERAQKVSERNKLILGILGTLAGAGGLVPVLAQIFFK
ncbi:hypothetical protein NGB25_07215 [Staphylococcus saprophyticus]|uniref:hypothetical protein n=1 Tax=Staphylococcus saprophyticus TaxID=29385 RepID=UPI002DB72BCE|nr:hypothetical protein [Staphylococcus saprophyticus]MEB7676934.1 hypothetical protein [Staphylococcus saprophyticus]